MGKGENQKTKEDIAFNRIIIQITFEYGYDFGSGIKMFIILNCQQITFWDHAKYQEKKDILDVSKYMIKI